MAEYIERDALIDAIEGINWYKYNDEGRLTQGGTSHDKMFLPYTAVEGTIKSAPAADVRPVVLCRDCRHRDPEDHKCDCGQLERAGCVFPVADDYYCAYGEE